MTPFLPYVAALSILAALALISGRHVPIWTVATHALLCAAVLAIGLDVQGRAKPFWAEWRDRSEVEVIAAMYHPGTAIYVLIRDAGPRLYALDWDVNLAREMQEAEAGSGGIILRRGEADERDGGQNDGPWQAHPLPVPANPEKEAM